MTAARKHGLPINVRVCSLQSQMFVGSMRRAFYQMMADGWISILSG